MCVCQKQTLSDALQNNCSWKFRNIHRKISVLESLFNKVLDLKVCNFIEKILQHRCFPVKITKFLTTAFYIEHFWWLLLVCICPSFWCVYAYMHVYICDKYWYFWNKSAYISPYILTHQTPFCPKPFSTTLGIFLRKLLETMQVVSLTLFWFLGEAQSYTWP